MAVTLQGACLTFVAVQTLSSLVELLDVGALCLLVLLPFSLKDGRFTELFLEGLDSMPVLEGGRAIVEVYEMALADLISGKSRE